MAYPKGVRTILKDIKDLRIQGARSVALSSLDALTILAKSKKKDGKEFLEDVLKLMVDLTSLRETEPMQRNLLSILREFFTEAYERGKFNRELVINSVKVLKEEISSSFNALTDMTSNLMEGVVGTYCHSSTVEKAIIKAYERGEVEEVIVFETRPRYQGRITAKALSKAGVPVTFYVDGAMAQALKKVDYIFVGADAFTSEGHLINKVGTHTLSIVAKTFSIPFYSSGESLKYDPHTEYGFKEKIEERTPEEVWEEAPKGVRIRNPAFDLVPNGNISGIVSEMGVSSPVKLSLVFEKRKKELMSLLISILD